MNERSGPKAAFRITTTQWNRPEVTTAAIETERFAHGASRTLHYIKDGRIPLDAPALRAVSALADKASHRAAWLRELIEAAA